jgi:hypothetical protein
MKRFLLGLVAVVVVLAGAWPQLSRVIKLPSFEQSQRDEKNFFFYRVHTKLTYKPTGEPLEFDVVVACNYHEVKYRDGDRSVLYGSDPEFFAKKVGGNHVVMMQVPKYCPFAEQIAKPMVQLGQPTFREKYLPPDFMPLLIWFDDASDLRFGIGYISDDAYENPSSKMSYHATTITQVSRTERDAWQASTGVHNLIKPYHYQEALAKSLGEPIPYSRKTPFPKANDYTFIGKKILPVSHMNFPFQCRGYIRVKLSEPARAFIRQHWPAHRPTYWAPVEDKMKRVHIQNDGSDIGQYAPSGSSTVRGMARRGGLWSYYGGHSPTRRYVEPVYPMRLGGGDTALTRKLEDDAFIYDNIEISEATRGFVYCERASGLGVRLDKHQPAWVFVPQPETPATEEYLRNNDPLHRRKRVRQLNGVEIDDPGLASCKMNCRIIEADEFLWQAVELDIWGQG